ncbi:hypothetical protein [Bacillus sp. EAC]|uniref:hypothetical protein n=1 Tax=Bacillus sp. EAC TaxID=1978338 RepID=UPI000B437033|nr:hypothetical protein [Bacillus sp. EAC]
MNRLLKIITLIIILLVVLFYLKNTKTKVLKENISLKNNIATIVNSRNSIDFAKETDFQWDEMIIFPPYAQLETDFKKLKIKTNVKKIQTPIESNDGINLIVYTKNHKIVSYVNNRRDKGDFPFTNNRIFTNKNAKFKIIKDENGWIKFVDN